MSFRVLASDRISREGLAPLAATGAPAVLATDYGWSIHERLKAGRGHEALDQWRDYSSPIWYR